MERSQLHKKAKDAWEPLAMMSLSTQPTAPVSQETPLPEWLQPGCQPTKYPGYMMAALQQKYQQQKYQRKRRKRRRGRTPQQNTQGCFIASNKDIGSRIAPLSTPTWPNRGFYHSNTSPRIPLRVRPHQALPCTPYNHRDAQRTSRRGRN